ncbi:hypothetical protein SAMN05444161_5856 [Rhizobiales bacterium GAS191]|nr:hypothetical protein SAMN05444161_5856 [Rhizobiales bacterium GAS191]
MTAIKAFAASGLLAASWNLASPVLARDFTQDRSPPASLQCVGDTIVWVNTKTGVYHFPGMTWYGHTKEGKYICKGDADREGDRPTLNGQ